MNTFWKGFQPLERSPNHRDSVRYDLNKGRGKNLFTGVRVKLGFKWQDPVESCCQHGTGPSVSKKGGEFLDQLSKQELLKKDSTPWSKCDLYYLFKVVT
jgi:hypothetical protein